MLGTHANFLSDTMDKPTLLVQDLLGQVKTMVNTGAPPRQTGITTMSMVKATMGSVDSVTTLLVGVAVMVALMEGVK